MLRSPFASRKVVLGVGVAVLLGGPGCSDDRPPVIGAPTRVRGSGGASASGGASSTGGKRSGSSGGRSGSGGRGGTGGRRGAGGSSGSAGAGGSSSDSGSEAGGNAGSGGVSADAGADAATEMDAAGTGGGGAVVDTGPPPEDGGFHVAAHPAPPQILFHGGPTLKNPRLVPITYADYALRTVVDDFAARIGTDGAAYFTAVTRDYDVGTPTSQPIHLAGNAPSAIDDLQIRDFLAGRLDGTHAEYGTPADHPVYLLYYPAATAVTHATLVGCSSFYGYHDELALPSGPYAGQKVAYVVVPECTASPGAEYNTTASTSHELMEAVTDPFGTAVAGTGWNGLDDDHLVWEIRGGEGEVGDLCEGIYGGMYVPFPFPYLVQRIWSNSEALAGRNPCTPPLLGGWAYFNAAPVMNDTVNFRASGVIRKTKGVRIPIGESRTIEVALFSSAPTDAWTVSASDLSPLYGPGPRLEFSWDATTGNNGTKLHLTIKALKGTARFGGEPFLLTSSDGIQHHEWLGYVAQD